MKTMKQSLHDLQILYNQEADLKKRLAEIEKEINEIKLQLLNNLNLNK